MPNAPYLETNTVDQPDEKYFDAKIISDHGNYNYIVELKHEGRGIPIQVQIQANSTIDMSTSDAIIASYRQLMNSGGTEFSTQACRANYHANSTNASWSTEQIDRLQDLSGNTNSGTL